jgi:hypothetical protein
LGSVALACLLINLAACHDSKPVPSFALFHDRNDIGLVGEGTSRRYDGSRSQFYYFAPSEPIAVALPLVKARLAAQGWSLRDATSDRHPLFTAVSGDGATCIRYVSLEGDYTRRVEADPVLSRSRVDESIEFGAVLAVVVELDCDRGR